jgi:myo-inositol catabolism protein IolC
VDGYVGFAIGRSSGGDPLRGWIEGALSREAAASQIAANYLRFIEVYTAARVESA